MNKIQYIKLLNLRGITELNGKSIAQAVRDTGGDPTYKEMVEVNRQAMEHFLNLSINFREDNEELRKENSRLLKRSNWLSCLEAAGLDNWEGCQLAEDIKLEREK